MKLKNRYLYSHQIDDLAIFMATSNEILLFELDMIAIVGEHEEK